MDRSVGVWLSVLTDVLNRSNHTTGKVLVSTGRKGKCMWIVLEEGGGATGKGKKKKKGAAASPSSAGSGGHLQQQQHVLLHMGMTGSLVVKGKDVPQVGFGF